jgi:hypothetical protein
VSLAFAQIASVSLFKDNISTKQRTNGKQNKIQRHILCRPEELKSMKINHCGQLCLD